MSTMPCLVSCFAEVCADERLAVMITAAELRDYFRLITIADKGGDPGFIPAHRMERARRSYKLFGGDMPEEKWERRRARWAACDLVEQLPEGLLLTYVTERDDDEDDAPPASIEQVRPVRVPRHNRPYSMKPDARKKREQRARNGQQPTQNGHSAPENGDMAGTNVPKIGDILRDNAGTLAGTSLARVSPNVYVTPKEITKLSSESETLTSRAGTTTATMSPPEVSPGAEMSPPGELSPAPNLPPAPPPSPSDVNTAKNQAVNAIIRDTGDGQQFRGLWLALWQHCYDHDALTCWNGAVSVLANRLRIGPTPPNLGKWTQGVLKNLLDDAERPYKGKIGPTPAIDPAELADVRRQVRESMGLPLDYAPADGQKNGDNRDMTGTNVPLLESNLGARAGKTAENVPEMSPPQDHQATAQKLAEKLGDKRAAPRIARLLDLCPPADEQKIVTACLDMAASTGKNAHRRADYFADHLAGVLRGRKIDVPADLLPAPPVSEPIPEGDPDE